MTLSKNVLEEKIYIRCIRQKLDVSKIKTSLTSEKATFK